MALWNQPSQEPINDKVQTVQPTPAGVYVPPANAAPAPATPVVTPRESVQKERRETVFGTGVSMEGKIEGDSDVRIAGKFKGEIQIKGDLTIDKGANVSAKVSATNIAVAGEINGNVTASAQLKLLESAQIVGDLKASTVTVAAGSRVRGHVEFGWSASEAAKFGSDKKHDGEKFDMAEL